MKVVADHLFDWTRDASCPDIDSFARSAFNRYYYSCFWTVRAALVSVDPKLDERNHKDVPVKLNKRFKRRVVDRLGQNGPNDPYAGDLRTIKTLITVIVTGYTNALEVRRQADYEIDTRVVFDKHPPAASDIKLNGMSLKDMQTLCKNAGSLKLLTSRVIW